MSNQIIALLDLDPLVYSCAFAGQKKWYLGTDEEGTPLVDFTIKQVASHDWRAYDKEKTEVLAAYDRQGLIEAIRNTFGLADVEEYLMMEELPFVYQMAKTAIQSIMRKTECTHFQGVLSRGETFRHRIATLKEYKGNRKNTPKPAYYNQMREYFANVWGAHFIDYYEADDYLAMMQHQSPEHTIICSIDKDLLTVPGDHYVHNRTWEEQCKRFTNTPEEAYHFFLCQMLMGDRADNIPGIPRIGLKTAEKRLSGLSLPAQFEAVREAYRGFYGDHYEYRKWGEEDGEKLETDWEGAMTEVGQLLWMVRSKDEPLWTPAYFDELIGELK